MFRDNTVFVIGAGASAEFKLPVGWQLMNTIKENTTFDLDSWGNLKTGRSGIFNHYEQRFGRSDRAKIEEFNKRLEVSRQISAGIDSADSIDEYIFRYSHDPLVAEVGKLQIAYAIANAEKESILSPTMGFADRIGKAENTWIWHFAKALFTGIKAKETDKIGNNITIICFNYDRCIEHYLEYAIVNSFHGMTIPEARKIVANIEIIHPYGKLGELSEFPFGSADKFVQMADNVITWSETVRDPNITSNIEYAIKNANALVFLGFAFAKQNMDLMRVEEEENKIQRVGLLTLTEGEAKDVYATAYGFKKQVHGKIADKITSLWTSEWNIGQDKQMNIEAEDIACHEFMKINMMNLVE